MKDHNEKQFYATFKRYPRTDSEVNTRIGKINPIAQCLGAAFDDLIAEEESCSEQPGDEDEYQEGMTDDATREKKIIIDEGFKSAIVEKFGEAMSKAFFDRDALTVNTKSTKAHVPDQPAGILKGRIKHYNRFGGQWRICVTDAELRPRVNINHKKLGRGQMISLETCSRRHMEEEFRCKRRRIELADSDFPRMESDGAVKIDGELMILAFDDKT